jgi:hypothetical protein
MAGCALPEYTTKTTNLKWLKLQTEYNSHLHVQLQPLKMAIYHPAISPISHTNHTHTIQTDPYSGAVRVSSLF